MKLTATQIGIILLQAKDRITREFNALQYFRETAGSVEDGVGYNDAEFMRAALLKYRLPANLWLAYEEGFDNKQTITDACKVLGKILRQKSSFGEILDLTFHAAEMDEFDIGWFVFGQPLGYYGNKPGQLWLDLERTPGAGSPEFEALTVMAGISKGHGSEDAIFSAMIHAEQHFGGVTTAIHEVIRGGDPMQAVRELLGDSLVESF